jgi:hypothetical protein
MFILSLQGKCYEHMDLLFQAGDKGHRQNLSIRIIEESSNTKLDPA